MEFVNKYEISNNNSHYLGNLSKKGIENLLLKNTKPPVHESLNPSFSYI